MSILNKLKNASGQMSNRLLEKHPLAGESLELRLQYLAAIALATAIDREATLAERQAFNGLAASLAIEAGDAEEQFNERASVEEESINLLFEIIRSKGSGFLYALDLSWISSAAPVADHREIESINYISDLSGVPEDKFNLISRFTRNLREGSLETALQETIQALEINEIQDLFGERVKKEIGARDIIDGRWVIHDDYTATDSVTGITWLRQMAGKFSIYSKGCEASEKEAIEKEVRDKSIESNLIWMIPARQDVSSIFSSKIDVLDSVFGNIHMGGVICSQDLEHEKKIKSTMRGLKIIDELPEEKSLLLCRKR